MTQQDLTLIIGELTIQVRAMATLTEQQQAKITELEKNQKKPRVKRNDQQS
jgi:hypothetical protein